MAHPLDDPVRSSLTGPHAHLAGRRGNILYYPTRANQYLCLPDPPGARDWADIAIQPASALCRVGGAARAIIRFLACVRSALARQVHNGASEVRCT